MRNTLKRIVEQFENIEIPRIVISLWNHWLSREEQDHLFPKDETPEYEIACQNILNCFNEIICTFENGVYRYDDRKNQIKWINKEETIKENPNYSPNRESNLYINNSLKMGIQMGYDFCISLYQFDEDVNIQIDQILLNNHLKIVIE